MERKGFLYARAPKGTKEKCECFGDTRKFVEDIFSKSGFAIGRYGLTYKDEHQKDKTATYLYKLGRKEKFDELPTNVCGLTYFHAFGATKYIWDNCMSVYIRHSKDRQVSMQIVWAMSGDIEQDFPEQVTLYQQLIGAFFQVDYLFAGTMSPDKAINLFILGMLHETFTTLEKNVAYGIQLATFTDERMPFLFPYTYCSKILKEQDLDYGIAQTFFQPSLIMEPLDSYELNPQWQKYYMMLQKRNLVIPLKEQS